MRARAAGHPTFSARAAAPVSRGAWVSSIAVERECLGAAPGSGLARRADDTEVNSVAPIDARCASLNLSLEGPLVE